MSLVDERRCSRCVLCDLCHFDVTWVDLGQWLLIHLYLPIYVCVGVTSPILFCADFLPHCLIDVDRNICVKTYTENLHCIYNSVCCHITLAVSTAFDVCKNKKLQGKIKCDRRVLVLTLGLNFLNSCSDLRVTPSKEEEKCRVYRLHKKVFRHFAHLIRL